MQQTVRRPLLAAAAAATLLYLAACGTSSTPQPPQTPLDEQTGTISGRVTAGQSAAGLPSGGAVPRISTAAWQPEGGADFVTGELIVAFASDVTAQGISTLHVDGVQLHAARSLALTGARLFRGAGLSPERTLELARALNARSDVRYAQPNYVVRPLLTPDDTHYALQWHYPAINLPQAWDITTGSASVVVAVVDSGILFDLGNPAISHPDFAGKVLPGYDFVSDPQISGDGDGRDPNPYDDSQQQNSHGTHVAGTVAAATNNGSGVAGVDWQARVVPVRVLGAGGGSLLDVVEGTLWAAGFPVQGVPSNANPAHVINMSLGGAYGCTPFEQDAFDRIATQSPRKAVVVVAAGNDDANAAGFAPASCANVITVGATEFRGVRAPYSNFGTRVDVMAPGGDVSADRNGDGFADGVLSTDYDGTNLYTFLQGTSMAAPHVAGVISLMKALDASLTPTQALAYLTSTARPLGAAECARPSGAECGAGLIDAAAALSALQAGDLPTPGGGALAFDPNPLDFGALAEELAVTLTNTTAATVEWSIIAYDPDPTNPGEMLDGSVFIGTGAPGSGALAPGASVATSIGIDRTRVGADGAYRFELVFEAAGAEQALTVRFTAGVDAAPGLVGPMLVAAFVEDPQGELVLSGIEARGTFFSSYSFQALPGSNIVVAWSDENDNGEIDAADYLGIYPDYVQVTAGAAATGIDFSLERVISLDAVEPNGPAARVDRATLTRLLSELEGR